MKLVHACRHWTQAQALHTKWAPDIIDCMFACMKCNGKDYIPSGHLTISTHTCHSKPTAAVHLCNAASLPDAVTVVCRSASTYGLAAGQYNDLATPFMSMPGDTIRYIFSVEGGSKGRQDYTVCNETSACHFTPRSLGILCAFYLMLMALASGVAVPGGLFMPSIMVSLLPSIIISLCLLSWSVFAIYCGQSLPSIMGLCLQLRYSCQQCRCARRAFHAFYCQFLPVDCLLQGFARVGNGLAFCLPTVQHAVSMRLLVLLLSSISFCLLPGISSTSWQIFCDRCLHVQLIRSSCRLVLLRDHLAVHAYDTIVCIVLAFVTAHTISTHGLCPRSRNSDVQAQCTNARYLTMAVGWGFFWRDGGSEPHDVVA